MTDLISRLRSLRAKANSINATLVDDLYPFFGHDKPVFRRLPIGSDEEGNVTTTCSCLMSLATSRKLVPAFIKIKNLPPDAESEARDYITTVLKHAVTSPWTSSDLKDLNAFSGLLVLRAAGILSQCAEKPLKEAALDMTHPKYDTKGNLTPDEPARSLKDIVKKEFIETSPPKSFRVGEFPATPAIGYWFVDAIDKLVLTAEVEEEQWESITLWASKEFAKQLALVTSEHAAMMDPVAMAAAACLCTRLRRLLGEQDIVSSKKRDELMVAMPTRIEVERAILQAFVKQQISGIWPKYFPLFNYGEDEAGSNYFFSFELLEVVVGEFEKSELLEDVSILKGIERALDWCDGNRLEYKVGQTTFKGWNSGGQITTLSEGKPESWATAVIHMFLRKLRSALSYSIRKHILEKYEAPAPSLVKKSDTDWKKQLDSTLRLKGEEETSTVINLLEGEILTYIDESTKDDPDYRMEHRRSALLFGPPGTSKTSLVRALAIRIGWSLVELNPSDFLKQGLENIYSQTNEIFTDLTDLWRVVVFFDEMDALAQKRAEGIDIVRQLLTTSMLPKLSRLHDDARVIFFMATNHQRNFDDAIKRPGRFDLLICMGPPPWTEKLRHLEEFCSKQENASDVGFIRNKFSQFVPNTHRLVPILDLFTFSEFKSFLESIRSGGSLKEAVELLQEPEFTKKVEDWGVSRIALRPQTEPIPSGELSLREEYDLVDTNASLKQ